MSYPNIEQDINWIWTKYPEFQKVYPDQFIAVRDQEVITAGPNQGTVLKIARYLLGHCEFVVEFIESGETIVLYFTNSTQTD